MRNVLRDVTKTVTGGGAIKRLADSPEYVAAAANLRRIRDKSAAHEKEKAAITRELYLASEEGRAARVADLAAAVVDGGEVVAMSGTPDQLRSRLGAIRSELEILGEAARLAREWVAEISARVGGEIVARDHLDAHRRAVSRMASAIASLEDAIIEERKIRDKAITAAGVDALPSFEMAAFLRLGGGDMLRADWERRAKQYADEG